MEYDMNNNIFECNTTSDWLNHTDISMLLKQLRDHEKDENICNNENFEVEYLWRPVAEATLKDFIDTCIRNISNFPESWPLCTRDGDFNCDPVTGYVTKCEAAMMKNYLQHTTSEPCTMGTVMGQSTGLLILFSLVFIGILIGISVTVAGCLICPQLHSWANKKIRGDHIANHEKTTPTSVFHLESIDSQYSGRGQPETPHQHHRADNSLPAISNCEGDSINEYTYIGAGRPRMSDSQSVSDYEGLTRINSQQQSHKYAHLPQTVPDDRHSEAKEDNEQNEDYAHNYFVLEENRNQEKV